MNIKGHSAVVIGGSGPGAETARRLAAAGGKVAVLNPDEATARAAGGLGLAFDVSDARGETQSPGPATHPVPCDLRVVRTCCSSVTRSAVGVRCIVARGSVESIWAKNAYGAERKASQSRTVESDKVKSDCGSRAMTSHLNVW